MATRARISKAFPEKGELGIVCSRDVLLTRCRFGWVNASYVVGLSIVSVHMRRALGTLTKWTTFAKATEIMIDDDGSSELELSPVGIAAEAIPEEGSSEIDGVPTGNASEALVEDGETETD